MFGVRNTITVAIHVYVNHINYMDRLTIAGKVSFIYILASLTLIGVLFITLGLSRISGSVSDFTNIRSDDAFFFLEK